MVEIVCVIWILIRLKINNSVPFRLLAAAYSNLPQMQPVHFEVNPIEVKRQLHESEDDL